MANQVIDEVARRWPQLFEWPRSQSQIDWSAPREELRGSVGKTATDVVLELGTRYDEISRVLDSVSESLEHGHYMTALQTIRDYRERMT